MTLATSPPISDPFDGVFHCCQLLFLSLSILLPLHVTAASSCDSIYVTNSSLIGLVSNLNVPAAHLPYTINANAQLKQKFLESNENFQLNANLCWGYESNCTFENSYSSRKLSCNKKTSWRLKDSQSQQQIFWKQADFGKLIDLKRSIQPICASKTANGSHLECCEHLRFCKASNIFFDFKNLNAKSSKRYRSDVILKGNVGGNCNERFDKALLLDRCDEKSYLQSWGSELENFETYPEFEVNEQNCDIIFERATILIKLDASVNMYHHFCDFINVYLSQHLNGTTFDMDVDIVWWDTFHGGFIDKSFGTVWKAFSTREPIELISFDNKRVCFRNAILSLLARQRLGLYYNMPLIDGCEGSGLFEAFSEHILHRLGVEQQGPTLNAIRITFLSRSTKYRRILNEDQLINELEQMPNVIVRRVDYNDKVPFLEQLRITHNTDILMGMHGSGLTHLLFLPKWAVVFEIYNCDDATCYFDLARLRGIKYFTWRNPNKMQLVNDDGVIIHIQKASETIHKKFANYRFDKEEFREIAVQVVEQYCRHSYHCHIISLEGNWNRC